MSSMSPKAAEILARARADRGLEPSAEQRMSSLLLQRVARGQEALPGIDASPVRPPRLSWALRLLNQAAGRAIGVSLGLVVLASAIIASMLLRSNPRPEAPRASASDQIAPAPTVVAEVEAPPPPPTAAPQPEASEPSEPRRPARPRTARARTPKPLEGLPAPVADPAPNRAEPPPPSVATTTLEAELRLLRQAHQELNAGRAQRALAVLEEHATRFPRGELAQARELASMQTLRAAGRAREACARAQRFVTAHPSSPFLAKVQATCPARERDGFAPVRE